MPTVREELAKERAIAEERLQALEAAEEAARRTAESSPQPSPSRSAGPSPGSSPGGPRIANSEAVLAPCEVFEGSPASSQDTPSLLSGVGSLLSGLDRLLSESGLSGGPPPELASFRVQVPAQYPGVQFRKSKCMEDRYPRYAKNGTVVKGIVEDDGAWLRLGEAVFLPMRAGNVDILVAEGPAATSPQRPSSAGGTPGGSTGGRSMWFVCGQGNREEGEEIVDNGNDRG